MEMILVIFWFIWSIGKKVNSSQNVRFNHIGDIFSPKKDAVGDSNYNKKGGAGADGDIKKGDGTSAFSKLPVHVFSFAGKSDEKSSPKRGSVRKKRASKTSQYRGPDVIQQITPPVSEQRPSEVEDVSIEKGPVSSQKLSKDEPINIENHLHHLENQI